MEILSKAGLLGILSIISGLLYRAGGIGKPFKSWMRDWLCPLIALIALWFLVGFKLSYWWAYLSTYALMGSALSTYWDRLPYNKGKDNFFMHGFFVGLAAIPCIFLNISLYVILIRVIILAVLTFVWSEKISNVFWEEFGRGFLIIITIPLLLL